MLDRTEFDVAMNRLSVLPLQGEDPNDMLTRKLIYYDALSDLGTELFVAGAKAALRECRWFPTPAELRERASRPAFVALPAPPPADIEAARLEVLALVESVRGMPLRQAFAVIDEALPAGQDAAKQWQKALA